MRKMDSEHITRMGITLVPMRWKTSQADLLGELPGVATILVADYPIEGAERWDEVPGGWRTVAGGTEVFNIDHHAPARRMEKWISSGNLAAAHVGVAGVAAAADAVVINHCDADSIISSAILRGLVQPEARFLDAVIAADHTGAENTIADALQALEQERDLDIALQTLLALRDGEELPARAADLLELRRGERRGLRALLEEPGRVRRFGPVTVLAAGRHLPAEMLTPLLPDAAVIVVGYPRQGGGHKMKIRLGNAAPEGVSLSRLGITSEDPDYGGRWNAGSNNRGGGTDLDPFAYGQMLEQEVTKGLASS